MTNHENTFYKTFSGTDSLAFMLLPESKPILLGSLTTISYSMYRDKKPVALVGKVNVSGYTRGMRVIAGSMVFTLINQHLTKDLVEQVPYLNTHGKMKADELPLFDIMIISSNEYGFATRMMIYGIDITDDAQVLTIQDLFTENTFNFVARDLDEFTAYKDIVRTGGSRSYSVNSITPYNFNIDDDEYENYKNLFISNIKNEELLNVQSKLVKYGTLNKVTGIYDNHMLKAVKSIQKENKLDQTGILDKTTFDLIMLENDEEEKKLICINSINGAYVYDNSDKDKIIGIAKYKEKFLAKEDENFYIIQFYGNHGYIEKKDIESPIKYEINLLNDNFTVNNYIGDFSDIGLVIKSDTGMNIKICALSFYNDKKESFTKYIEVHPNKPKAIALSDISDAYIYNLHFKSKPEKILFIILNQGKFIYKWDLTIGGDVNGYN